MTHSIPEISISDIESPFVESPSKKYRRAARKKSLLNAIIFAAPSSAFSLRTRSIAPIPKASKYFSRQARSRPLGVSGNGGAIYYRDTREREPFYRYLRVPRDVPLRALARESYRIWRARNDYRSVAPDLPNYRPRASESVIYDARIRFRGRRAFNTGAV